MAILIILFICFGIVNGYDRFEKNLPWQFPYAPNLICDVVEHAGMFYASVADAYSFQRSQAVAVWPSSERLPQACFQYDGRSYLFFLVGNRTELLRNRENKTLSSNSKLLFDGIKTNLYIYDNNILRSVDLDEVWSSGQLITQEIIRLSGRVLDVMVADGELHYLSVDSGLVYDFIEDRLVRKPNSKNILTRMLIAEQEKYTSVSTNATRFKYIAVTRHSEDYVKITTDIKF